METNHSVRFIVEAFLFISVMLELGHSDQQSTREPSCINTTGTATVPGECLKGFYGPKCNCPCRHPNYGELCQSHCNCTEQYCNHITGCQDSCSSTKRFSGGTNEAMLISTIVFSLIAVLQFAAYLSLRFIRFH